MIPSKGAKGAPAENEAVIQERFDRAIKTALATPRKPHDTGKKGSQRGARARPPGRSSPWDKF